MQSAAGQNGNGRAPHGDHGVAGGELYLHLFRLARASARRHGGPDREVDDCAIEFVTRMLHYDCRPSWPHEPGPGREAWLRGCAATSFVPWKMRTRSSPTTTSTVSCTRRWGTL